MTTIERNGSRADSADGGHSGREVEDQLYAGGSSSSMYKMCTKRILWVSILGVSRITYVRYFVTSSLVQSLWTTLSKRIDVLQECSLH